ncbi:hypothetical protein [Listeria monocytogenes]|uniref:hypothetical protein n=1 Tax=Listeria monocytogenes TaxID=1639 RepID=UPI00135B39A0|nr:hypothetical protein [Listeria monocytogenes]
MNCPICKDKRTIWQVNERSGIFICRPCPVCNKNGVKVERRQKELEKLRKSL